MAKLSFRMTVQEVMRDMRNCGERISQETLTNGMAAGVFPFGTMVSEGATGRRTFIILREQYEQWKKENMRGCR